MLDIFYWNGELQRCGTEHLPAVRHRRLWIDATAITKEEAELLTKLFRLHTVTTHDLFLESVRVKVEEFPNYMICTFYGADIEDDKINITPLDFVFGHNFIITTHQKPIKNYETLKKEEETLKTLFIKGVPFLFHRLLDDEITNFVPVLGAIEDEIEKIDEGVAIKANSELLNRILNIKKKIVEIKKITFPQREHMSFLARRKYKFIPEHSQPYFRDVYDNTIWVSDVMETQRESIGTAFEVYMTSINNHMSEVMKVLSVIATIALPMTVISGIYGTNFLKLPGAKTANGFWIMMGLMGIMMIGMIIFFKKRKWF